MAVISVAKLLLVICAITVLLTRRSRQGCTPLDGKFAPIAVLLAIFAFAASLIWTIAPQDDALGSLAKHGKLIVIVLMMLLIRDRREAGYALASFVLAQSFLLASSWMLFAHLPVPWATSNMAMNEYAVFSSYLDQGIISAVFAAVCWHLRELAPGRFGRHIAVFLSILALANVFFMLMGRSGHIVAIALLSIAIMWELPKKYRALAIMLPFLLAMALFFTSTKVRQRLTLVETEVQSYSVEARPVTSSGLRLAFWHAALLAISQHPLVGSGVGSWSTSYNHFQRARDPAHKDIDGNGNPHQEYLLWGVQLGIPGILLLFLLLLSIGRDSTRMKKPYARATQSTLLALSTACLFNASIYDAQIGDFFCVLLGLLLASGFSNTSDDSIAPHHPSEANQLKKANSGGASATLTIASRLARVWPYFSGSHAGWALAIGATIVAALTEPFIPALLKPLLDRGFQRGSLNLWLIPLALLLLFTIRGVSGFMAQFALARVTNDGLLRLRTAMFDKLLSARLTLFQEQSSSAISNTVVYEVFNGSSSMINAMLRLVRDALTLLALIAYLVYLNWKLTLIVGLLFPAVALVIQVLSRRLYRLTKQSQAATDSLAYVVEENVMAHRDIRLHGAQGAQAGRFDTLSHSLRRLSMKSTTAYAGMSAITQVLAAIALSAVISIALMQSAENTTTVGGFVAFVTAMLLLIAPIKSLSDAATPVTRGLAALERGLDLVDLTPNEAGGVFAKDRVQGAIEFMNVTVNYNGAGTPALNDLSLCINPGETLAIVGASGSGKTTMVNLLARFIEMSSGGITLDGQEIRNWQLKSLRSQFAFVSQHVVMLNSSMAVNVALGQPIDRERVSQCLTAANLGVLLAELPQGLDTVLGHNAMQLSGGQRQRVAIARALYKDAPVLVLDEATSALDTESELAVQEAIKRLAFGRTSLVIAHRLSTIQYADRIIVMDGGRIVESGTHAELIAKNGAYAHLYRLGFKQA